MSSKSLEVSPLRPIDTIDNRKKSLHIIPYILQDVVCYRTRSFAFDVFGNNRQQILGSCSATITRQIKATGPD